MSLPGKSKTEVFVDSLVAGGGKKGVEILPIDLGVGIFNGGLGKGGSFDFFGGGHWWLNF